MKAIEHRLVTAEKRLNKQFGDAWTAELRKETNTRRDKVHAVIDDLKAYMEISLLLIQGDDMNAVIKMHQDMVTIIDHYLPECAARIRGQIQWL